MRITQSVSISYYDYFVVFSQRSARGCEVGRFCSLQETAADMAGGRTTMFYVCGLWLVVLGFVFTIPYTMPTAGQQHDYSTKSYV